MADDWVLNKIDGGSLLVGNEGTRFIQSGAINNIDTTSISPTMLLYRVIQIAEANGYFINPPSQLTMGGKTLILRRIQVTGYTSNGCDFLFHWETPQLGPPSIYTIRKSTVLTPYQTDLMPGTRVPLRMADTVLANLAGATIPGKNVLFTFLKPLETIRVYSLTYSEPKYASNRVGNVNHAPWPTATASLPTFGGYNPSQEQKGIGYWLLTEWETAEERYAGYFSLTAAAVSRVDEDWSYSAVLTDANGVPVKIDNPTTTAALMMAPAYSNSIIFNQDGMMRVGPYPTTNFATLFGF